MLMNCIRCHTPNEESARYCANCGSGLSYDPAVTIADKDNSTKILLIFLSWLAAHSIIYLVLSKVIIPNLKMGSNVNISRMYQDVGLYTGLITIGLLITLAIIVKKTTVRIFLLVYCILHIVTMFAYRVFV
jgi:hypothetical protein